MAAGAVERAAASHRAGTFVCGHACPHAATHLENTPATSSTVTSSGSPVTYTLVLFFSSNHSAGGGGACTQIPHAHPHPPSPKGSGIRHPTHTPLMQQGLGQGRSVGPC